MIAREVMRTRVLTARPDMTVRELARLLVEHRISGVPVVDEHGRLVGVVSQTDLVRHELEPAEGGRDETPAFYRDPEHALPRGFHSEAPDYTRVSEVMTPAVIAGTEDTPVVELARLMQRRHVHRVIITHRGALRGIVTSTDLLKVLVRLLGKGGG
ncbi:MAG: CBS domain-containing protein [Elusimicrobia bacterium]|nr:CBS domain-containing protein [Elusimicrobiota bacterium]